MVVWITTPPPTLELSLRTILPSKREVWLKGREPVKFDLTQGYSIKFNNICKVLGTGPDL